MALCRADAIRVTGDASNKVVPQANACPWIGQAFSFWKPISAETPEKSISDAADPKKTQNGPQQK